MCADPDDPAAVDAVEAIHAAQLSAAAAMVVRFAGGERELVLLPVRVKTGA